jgi:hydrophobic/amphiphilic exporter-1 (mainly G- bacteria), HAE1 family
MSLYEGAVKKPIMTSLCFLAVVIFGLFSLSKLPIDLYPDIDTNTIMVMTAYPGASASDIENNVTRPLENTLNAVSNLKHITSRSSENMSLITLEFEFGNDIDVLTNDVRDKLDMVSSQLPDDVENPIIFKFSTDMIPIVLLSVQANESQSALYKILDDRVVNPLARIPGVGTVSISGAPQREIQVYCDPNKLEAYHLSIETISSIIGAENKNIPGGTFDIGNETYSLRVEGEFNDSRQLEDIVVGTYNGASVYLRDVARVVDTVEERAQETYNNGVKGAMIIVQKQSGANSVEISRKVEEALPRLQKNLPSDVKLGVIVDTSDNILNTIDSLAETVLYALLFVVIVVFLFLGRWRATLIICITIPLSLIASFIYLAITGNTINIISLSSLSIAIGSCHIITINFKVGTGLSRHTCITTSKNHLCLTKLRILLQIITHLIADLLQRDFTISRIHQTDIERNNVRTVILHRSPCIIRISLAYSIVTYLHYFLILCHPLIGQLLRYLLSQLFTGTNRQFKLYSNTGIILCREKFCTNTFGTE